MGNDDRGSTWFGDSLFEGFSEIECGNAKLRGLDNQIPASSFSVQNLLRGIIDKRDLVAISVLDEDQILAEVLAALFCGSEQLTHI